MSLLSEKIFDASNNGQEIIIDYYPESRIGFENQKKAFKIRSSETTPSTRVKKGKGGIWIITDFGDDQTGRNAIQVYMKEEGVDYVEALMALAKKYNLTSEKPKARVEFKKPSKTETPGYSYNFNTKLSDTELHILGPQVTQQICDNTNLKSCKSVTHITKDGKKIITHSSLDYPIFAFDHTSWQKKYEPLNSEKAYRFLYSGSKPKNYVNGLNYVIETQRLHAEKVKLEWDFEKNADGPTKDDLKLDNIIIASGDRDALNLMSFGYNVIWLNSESDNLEYEVYKSLIKLTKNFYVLPDIDKTGKKQGVELALQFPQVKIIWLPKWLYYRKDFRGKPRKDFRDFVQVSYYSGNEDKFESMLTKLIQNALPMRFWDAVWQPKKGGLKYYFNNTYAMHFIENTGYYLYESDQTKEDYEFIKIDGNVVEKAKGHHIKKHLLNHLEEKNHSVDLRNMLLRTNQLSDKSLSQLNELKPSFKKGFVNSQYFFFKDCTWSITKNGIKKYKLGDVKNYVWKNNIIDFEPKIEKDHFTITSLDKGFDITINETNNQYLNYLINASRTYWKEELEDPFKTKKGIDKEAQKNYIKENRFSLTGKKLTEEQIFEQKQHLVNKIFTIGYLLHGFKDQRKAWAVYNMDNKIVEDGVSHGGTGKSLFFKMLFPILKNVKKIEGRQKGLADKDFLFDGVTDKTDLIFIDDADQYFRFNRFFTSITGDLQVNPKGTTAYEIDFENSAKIAISSNFGLIDVDGSTRRRLLFVLTSDYYHDKGDEYLEDRQVSDDFNNKQLIVDFTDEQWNHYYNFCAQSVKFYLSQSKKINPPLENITKRNLVREMKSPFKNWADSFFNEDNLDTEIEKTPALKDFQVSESQPKFSSNRFKKSIKSWCKFYEFEFNPNDYSSVKDGRIINKNPEGKTVEYFYIRTNKSKPINENHLYAEESKQDQPEEEDLPF